MPGWQSSHRKGPNPACSPLFPPPPQKSKGALSSRLSPPGSAATQLHPASSTDRASPLPPARLSPQAPLETKAAESCRAGVLFLNRLCPEARVWVRMVAEVAHRPPWPAAIFLPHLLPRHPFRGGRAPPQPRTGCLPLSGLRGSIHFPVNGSPHPCILLRILECQSRRGPH